MTRLFSVITFDGKPSPVIPRTPTKLLRRFFGFLTIPYLWIPFIIISRVVGANAFHTFGLSRVIPTAYIYSPLFSQKHKILYVPPTIIQEEEPMDHGELEWEFPPEKTPEVPVLPIILPDTNSTSQSTITIFADPFIIRWFRLSLHDYFQAYNVYTENEDPCQIIFLFV